MRLALLLSLVQALWIDVPFVTQDRNGCGSATVWMLLEYWKQGAAPPLDEIHERLFSEEAGGVYARDMEAFLREQGFSTFPFRGEWSDLQQHIAKGRPVIVCLELNGRGVPLHYVVVAGIDPVQNLVLINDPAQRKLTAVHRQEFERAWSGTGNWALLAVPQVDLASEAFRDSNHTAAKKHLNSALKTAPSDAHINDFLATVYFLENNTESALKYWNRAGKPTVESIRYDPPVRLDPVLMDKAFTFTRGEALMLQAYRTTLARLDGLGVFSRVEMDLAPAAEDGFDLVVRAAERESVPLMSWFRGVPYQTVYPELVNIGNKAVNLKSMLRWNPERKRASVAVSAPLAGNPKWRIEVSADTRRQEWKRSEVAAQLVALTSGRWTWASGVAVSARDSFNQGLGLKYIASSRHALVSIPERQQKLTSSVTAEAGRLFGASSGRFGKLQLDLHATWRSLDARFRAGSMLGSPPVDERFVLGLDRDHELWLRATRDPIATDSFVLTNFDFLKDLRSWSFFKFQAGPFLDVARSARWLADTGLQLRITALGSLSASVSYGKDLRTGGNVWFVNTSR